MNKNEECPDCGCSMEDCQECQHCDYKNHESQQKNLFTSHLNKVGETYFQHMAVAGLISLKLLASSIAQAVHALLSFINPPLGTDVCSLVDFLETKKPEFRAQCKEDEQIVRNYLLV